MQFILHFPDTKAEMFFALPDLLCSRLHNTVYTINIPLRGF